MKTGFRKYACAGAIVVLLFSQYLMAAKSHYLTTENTCNSFLKSAGSIFIEFGPSSIPSSNNEESKIAIRMLFNNYDDALFGSRFSYPVSNETLADRLAYLKRLSSEHNDYSHFGYGSAEGISTSSMINKLLDSYIFKNKGSSTTRLEMENEIIGRLFPIFYSNAYVDDISIDMAAIRKLRSNHASKLGFHGHTSLAYRMYAYDLQRTESLEEALSYLQYIYQNDSYDNFWKRAFLTSFALPYLKHRFIASYQICRFILEKLNCKHEALLALIKEQKQNP